MASDKILWKQLLTLQPHGDLSLHLQLRGAVAKAVLDRRLPVGAALPSSRQLADLLGISRNTVTAAYDSLARDGFILGQKRSKYVIHPEALTKTASANDGLPGVEDKSAPCLEKMLHKPSLARFVEKPLDGTATGIPSCMASPIPPCFRPPNGARWRSWHCAQPLCANGPAIMLMQTILC